MTDRVAQTSAVSTVPSSPSQQPGVRYKPMLLNAAVTVLCLTVVWGVITWQNHANRIVATFVVLTTSASWFLVWLVVRSRIAVRLRWAILAVICSLAALVMASVEIKGHTGNLVPIVGWRWPWLSGAGDVKFEPSPANFDDAIDEPAEPLEGIACSEPSGCHPFCTENCSLDGIALPVPPSWPQFLGKDRNAEVPDVQLDPDWQQRPPKQLWRISIGEDAGYSSCVAAAGHFFTQQQDQDREVVACYRVESGTPVWSDSYPARYESYFGGVGPRATPVLDDDRLRLYTLGATGILRCYDAWTGERIWSRDVPGQFGAEVLKWGNSCSPLVVGNLVVVSTGARRATPSGAGDRFATLVAYDTQTGQAIWSAGGDDAGYSSPALLTLAGMPQIVIFNANSVTGHDPATGQVVWRYDWVVDRPSVAQPIALPGDGLLITKGYGEGARRLNISRDAAGQWHAEEAWRDPRFLKTKFANSVIRGDHVFGISDGILECVEIKAAARRKWKARGDYGHGQMLLVGDYLLVQSEGGDVALVEANPQKHIEVARLKAFDFRTWNPPVLLGNRLLVRNDRQIACYELPLRKP